MNNLRIKQISQFIKKVRDCEDIDKEKHLVDKKLNKIRNKFMKGSSNSENKKYLWQLTYAYSMGYIIDFGYKEINKLMVSTKFSEKYTGYITATILIPENEIGSFTTMITGIKNDLYSKNQQVQSLALNIIGTTVQNVLVQNLKMDVLKLALGDSTDITPDTRKKALLCLLRIYRQFLNALQFDVKKWVKPLIFMLQKYQNNFSVVNAILSLIEGVVQIEHTKQWDEVVMEVIKVLQLLVIDGDCPKDHQYYMINHPWIQIKALKILSILSTNKDPNFKPLLSQVLDRIINSDHVTTVKNRNNIQGAILFEAIKVIIRYKKIISINIQRQILSLLVIFLDFQEVNIKYLAFDSSTNALVLPGSEDAFKDQMHTVLRGLDDLDPSINKRSLDLLYLMCNQNNVHEIIEELLKYTEKTDTNLQEELVLKIAILAESFAPNLEWYLDVIISLLAGSGNYITDDIWWRCCQIVTGFGDNINENLQKYSVGAVMHVLGTYNCSENLIKMASYILPEYGLQNDVILPKRMYLVLAKKFAIVSQETKCMILDAYFKIAGFILLKQAPQRSDNETLNNIITQFQMLEENLDLEIQKRSFEYLKVINSRNPVLYENIFQEMDTFDPNLEESNKLLSKMIKLLNKQGTTDATIVNQGQELIKKKQEILQGKIENYRLERKKGNLKYEDLFIEEENVDIKFYNHKNLVDLSNQRLALRGKNILLTPDNLQLPKLGLNWLKQLLIKPNGVLYEDKFLQIIFKSEHKFAKGRSAMRIQSKIGKISKFQLNISNDGGLKIHVSTPQEKGTTCDIMFNYINDDIITAIPVNEQNKTLQLNLPVFIHSFSNPYEMDNSTYMQVYNRFTNSDKYFKLDEFMQISLQNQSINEIMNKIKIILQNFLKMHVSVYPDENQIQLVYGTAQIYRQSQENQAVPYLVEIESFEENPEFLRLSIRCSYNPFIVHSLYQILNVFINMATS